MNGLALCAGYGGLELGIESFFDEYKTVCYVEAGLYPAAEIVKKMEKGWMDEAPIWSNVRTFDGSSWRGKVDIISGGFPCQPFSTAGKQLATADPRDLWPDVARIVGEVLPEYIFFENVPGIVKWRLDSIILDLHQVGYDCSWCVLGAVDAGAPHRRNRWFLFGVRNAANPNDSSKRPSPRTIQNQRNDISGSCENVSYTDGERRNKVKHNIRGGKLDVEGGGDVSHPYNGRRKISPSRKKSSVKMFGGIGQKGGIDKWEGRFETWWEAEPRMGRLADGCSHWVDKLRLLGNGVVPQQAHLALKILTKNLGLRRIENEN